MLPGPPLDLSTDRPILLLDIDGVINVFQCATARETQIAPYLPAIKLLPGLADWLARLDRAYALVWCSHWGALVNIDATLILEAPRILPHVPRMLENIGRALGVSPDRISIKATTGEALGFVGRREGAAAHAVAALVQLP